ncbi:MAG: CCA tRNA nucleotidyltransferase [Candidatus Poribacteria bacterium]|nr:CCA tRNA nucleotidyltransferase [Candidatus Poribacteria bacterium]
MLPDIPESLLGILHEIGEVGEEHAYLVGGSVRDILLKRPTIDIDIVVEGDALQVAKEMQSRWNGTLQEHQQFGTATVTPANPSQPKVDFVTARCETYQNPGTLPKVERGTIAEDLQRRDFSINALAMRLDSTNFGAVIDKTNGLDDLKTGTIRILHNKSFIDDPTRIFRACRYAGRYNFRIADADMLLIKEAIPLLAQLSGERIRNEIDRVLLEDNAPQIVQELAQFGVYEAIFPGWEILPAFLCDFQTAQQAISWASEHITDEDFEPNILRWIALFGMSNSQEEQIYQIEALCFRLVLEHQLRHIGHDTQVLKQEIAHKKTVRPVFEKLGLALSKSASVEYYNGKWCIVDAENRLTYVYNNRKIFKVQTPLTAYRQLLPILDSLTETTSPSKIYQRLKPFPLEALVLAYSDINLSQVHRKNVGDYLCTLRKIQPFITGDDLIQWGEKPGKTFKIKLWDLFAAQLDGKIKSKSDAFFQFSELKKHNANDPINQ